MKAVLAGAIATAIVLGSSSSAYAQNLMLQTWTFQEAVAVQQGSVEACATNAPAGTFWGGNQRQPVLKVHARVRRGWWQLSRCAHGIDAEAAFSVGPQRNTLIEVECVLYGHRRSDANSGKTTIFGSAELRTGPDVVANVVCRVQDWNGARGRERTHTTQKTMMCLSVNEDYRVTAGLEAAAEMGRGLWLLYRAESEFFTDDGTGLPAGMMVIIQSRGAC